MISPESCTRSPPIHPSQLQFLVLLQLLSNYGLPVTPRITATTQAGENHKTKSTKAYVQPDSKSTVLVTVSTCPLHLPPVTTGDRAPPPTVGMRAMSWIISRIRLGTVSHQV
jgi:hypothetical protein